MYIIVEHENLQTTGYHATNDNVDVFEFREQNMVQVLLTNCLELLNGEPRPDDHLEIITSSHYLLAEVLSLTNLSDAEQVLSNTEGSEGLSPVSDDDEFPWPKVSLNSDT